MRSRWLVGLGVLAVACADKAQNDDSGFVPDCPTWYIDYDGDGFGSDNLIFVECDQPDGFVADNSDCDDLDASLNPETTWYADKDGDLYGDPNDSVVSCENPEGYVLDSQDCDDEDPARNPNTLWFRDMDGDGYGYPGFYQASCERPDGYAINASDCDDSRDDIHPDADEVCDERDNNCDNEIDNDAVDAATWYPDDDLDGYGSPSGGVVSCDPVEGRVTDGSDCDDVEGTINPGSDEICNDGLDNDCDGGFDRCTGTLAAAQVVVEGDEESSQFGRTVSLAGDVNGDGYEDLWVSAYLDDQGGSDAGAVYLLQGPFSGTTDISSTADATLLGGTSSAVGGDNLGFSVSGGVDADGDGTPDVLVGSHRYSDVKNGMGCAALVLGDISGQTLVLPGDGDVTFLGESAWARMGHGVLLSEDMSGDGDPDVVVGAPYYPNTYEYGAFYVFDGPFTRGATYDDEDARLVVYGVDQYDHIGYYPRSLDYDGDGAKDLLFGAPQVDTTGSSAGAVYLYLASTTGVLTLDDADLVWDGLNAEDQAGFRVRVLGDLDGDGLEDLGVTAPGVDSAGVNAGAVYIVLGGSSGGLSGAAAVLTGALSEDAAGSDLDAGDMNGDGAIDLLIGASYAGFSGEGEVSLLYGTTGSPFAGSISLLDADVVISGEAPSDNVGGQVLFAPDLFGTGDGLSDLVLGVWTNDRGGNDAGGVFMVGSIGL